MDTSNSRCFCCRQCLSCTYFTCFGEPFVPNSRRSCGGRGYSINTCSCLCSEEVTCTCKCNVGKPHDVLQKLASIAVGAVLVVGGAALTVGSGGMAAFPILGGMVGGAGLSSTIHGVVKAGKGEKISASEYFVDVGVGAVTGAVGSGGTIVTEALAQDLAASAAKEACKKGGTKLAVRTVGGMTTSLVSTGVEEAGNCFKGKKYWDDYGNDGAMWAKGAAMGAIAGMGSHAWSEVKESAPVQDILNKQGGRNDGPHNPDPYLSDQNRKICSELVIPTAKGAYGIHKGLSEADEQFENNSFVVSHFQTRQYPHHAAWNSQCLSNMPQHPVPDRRLAPDHRLAPDLYLAPNHRLTPNHRLASNHHLAPDPYLAHKHYPAPDPYPAPNHRRAPGPTTTWHPTTTWLSTTARHQTLTWHQTTTLHHTLTWHATTTWNSNHRLAPNASTTFI
ncbi:NEDD4-binding protein 2 [Branchiostoma belcheri]|nr:NEDD4-binding protein 2 [Branchiostoma belcheri]